MNANELHDLYAPLWAKVPETRPPCIRGVRWDTGLVKDTEGYYTLDSKETSPVFYCERNEQIRDEAAAALCRVAVEDWLRNTETSKTLAGEPNRDLHTTLTEDAEYGVFVFVDWPRRWSADGLDVSDDRAMFSGPTIHHALVSAALAVAGSKA